MEYFNFSFWQGVGASLAAVFILMLLTPIKNWVMEYRINRKLKKLEQQLNILKWEKDHLEKVRKSSVALSRAVYSDIFWLLLFLSIGLGIPILGPVVADLSILFKPIVQFLLPLAIPIWCVSIVVAIENIRKFNNLKNYAEAIEKLDSKIETIEKRIEKLSSNK